MLFANLKRQKELHLNLFRKRVPNVFSCPSTQRRLEPRPLDLELGIQRTIHKTNMPHTPRMLTPKIIPRLERSL